MKTAAIRCRRRCRLRLAFRLYFLLCLLSGSGFEGVRFECFSCVDIFSSIVKIFLALQTDIHHHTHSDVETDQRGQAVAHKRKRRSGIREKACCDADVNKALYRDQASHTVADQGAGEIFCRSARQKAEQNDQEQEDDNNGASDEAQLLSCNREDEVVLNLGYEIAAVRGKIRVVQPFSVTWPEPIAMMEFCCCILESEYSSLSSELRKVMIRSF